MAPIRRARVVVRSASSGDLRQQQTTDQQGRFEFGNMPRGDYIIRVSTAGYLDAEYGQRAPGSGYPGTPIAVTSATTVKVVVPMRRGGALSGTLTDDLGEPEHGVDVRALRLVVKDGRSTIEVAGTSRTDPLGGFRITTLPPGSYVLVASVPKDTGERDAGATTDASVTYAPVYFPSAGAAPIPLALGEQRVDLNFQVLRRLTARVTGTITNIARTAGATVDLLPTDMSPFIPTQSVGLDADRSFTFEGVAPGTYAVVFRSGPTTRILSEDGRDRRMAIMTGKPGMTNPDPDVERRWATSTISVQESDVTGVALTLERGMQVSGHVMFDVRERTTTSVGMIGVLLTSTDADRNYAGIGEVNAEGRFTIQDVMPGTYRVSIFNEQRWYLQSGRIGGVDLLDEPIEVRPHRNIDDATLTVTDRPSGLEGTVRSSNGAPALDCTIVVFAEDARSWTPHSRRIVSTRPSTDGRFTVPALPSGAYYITAVTDWDLRNVRDPALLRLLIASSRSIQIRDGETVTTSLTLER
jgi:hypothetical protein